MQSDMMTLTYTIRDLKNAITKHEARWSKIEAAASMMLASSSPYINDHGFYLVVREAVDEFRGILGDIRKKMADEA